MIVISQWTNNERDVCTSLHMHYVHKFVIYIPILSHNGNINLISI